jgi:hypothetical protein
MDKVFTKQLKKTLTTRQALDAQWDKTFKLVKDDYEDEEQEEEDQPVNLNAKDKEEEKKGPTEALDISANNIPKDNRKRSRNFDDNRARKKAMQSQHMNLNTYKKYESNPSFTDLVDIGQGTHAVRYYKELHTHENHIACWLSTNARNEQVDFPEVGDVITLHRPNDVVISSSNSKDQLHLFKPVKFRVTEVELNNQFTLAMLQGNFIK